MRYRQIAVQVNLFGVSKSEELEHRVKELDESIDLALKRNEYSRAKELTDEQKKVIQELVQMGE